MIVARSLCRLDRERDFLREQLRDCLEDFVSIVMLYMLGWAGISKCLKGFTGESEEPL
jgi:hypothetical protein